MTREQSPAGKKMKLRYFPYRHGVAYGNLMFEGKSFPMNGGRFPKDHPFASNSFGMSTYPQIGTGEKIDKLRALGYYVSCFPEGDGLTFAHPIDWTQEKVIADIIVALDVTLTEIKEA